VAENDGLTGGNGQFWLSACNGRSGGLSQGCENASQLKVPMPLRSAERFAVTVGMACKGLERLRIGRLLLAEKKGNRA